MSIKTKKLTKPISNPDPSAFFKSVCGFYHKSNKELMQTLFTSGQTIDKPSFKVDFF